MSSQSSKFVHNSNGIRRKVRYALLGVAIAVFGLLQISSPSVKADGHDGTFVCFPSCSATDGRFLSIATQGVSSLSGQELRLALSAAPSSVPSSLIVSFFDGETGGLWDNAAASPLQMELYADPLGDGSGVMPGNLLATWYGGTMLDGQWTDMDPVQNTALAQLTAGAPYKYALRVFATNPLTTGTTNFKVRTNGTLGLRPQAFSFQAAFTGLADRAAYYPAWPALTPTTYDGTWTFAFSVPAGGASRLDVWDGDLDFGDANCLANDTDDLDSPALPPFLTTGFAVAQGVAGAGLPCAGGIGGMTTGNPADDSANGVVRRSPITGLGPNLYYRVMFPDGSEYANLNPSGNLEWEKFTLDADPNTPFDATVMDMKVPAIPAGIYEVRLEGVDIGNLNAWFFNYNALGLPPNGPPASEDAFYSIERYVWYDSDRDGIFDPTEQGIPGVVVARTDTATGQVQYATTGPDGSFSFRVAEGNYTLEVIGSNFDPSQPLNGLYFTGNNGQGTHTGEFAEVNGMGPNKPYDRRDFGYVANTPPTANDDLGGCACSSVDGVTIDVLANDTDVDAGQVLTVASITQPLSGAATLNGNNTVTYVPNAGFTGADSFTYTVEDGAGGSATGVVRIDVISDPPTLQDDAVVGNYGVPTIINVLANDTPPSSGALAVTSVTQGQHGAVAINGDGTLTYTPNSATFFGEDEFTYTVVTECGQSTALVRITIAEPLSSLSGYVYVDTNNDGVFASGEAPIAGVTVTLTGTDNTGAPVTSTTTTNAAGFWAFTNLKAGTYTVTETQPTAYVDGKDTQGTPGTGTTGNDVFANIVLAAGVHGVNNNFGELQFASISGYVYHDVNDDGVFGSGEAPIPGVTVTLTGEGVYGGPVTASTTTNAAGFWSFTDLVPGTYTVTETQPAGWLDGKDTQGTPGTGTVGNDVFQNVVLGPNVHGVNNNFGELLPTEPPPPPCDTTGYTTFSQGGWGAPPKGGNPGMLLKNNFSTVYPSGLTLGGAKTIRFTTAAAIEKYLPAGGPAKVLSASSTNPTKSEGVLSAQLLAVQLAVDFSRAGVLKSGLGDLVFTSGPVAGQSLTQVMAMANAVFGGQTSALPSGMNLSGLTSLLESVVNNYHEGTVNQGLLGCGTTPPPPPPSDPPPSDPPPTTGSGVCSGGVTKLVLKYIGSGSPSGVVRGQRTAPGKGSMVDAQVSGTSPVLYTFAVTDMGGLFDPIAGGRLANNLGVFIGNTMIADVHTSCSVPIFPGMKVGTQFEVVEVWTKGGGRY